MNATLLLEHYARIADAPDAIAQLRRFVLDLAVRGKLVDQDATDEPASALLKRIAAEKAKLRLRASVNPVTTDEPPFQLPTGWQWTTIGEICSKTGSGSTPRGGKEVYKPSGFPFLRSQNVYDDGLRLDDVAFIDVETHQRMGSTQVLARDLLLNITGGSMGRCCRIPDDFDAANVSQHVAILRLTISGTESFLHLLVRSPYFQAFIFDEQTGAGRGGLPKNRMDNIAVALPPLAEQRRIVAKVDELMALCDQLEAARKKREAARDKFTLSILTKLNDPNLATFREDARFALANLAPLTTRPEQIKRLRQTILNLAVRGKLVEQDAADEPAKDLVQNIQRPIQDIARGLRLRAPQLPAISDEQAPFELPVGWCWARFPELGAFGRGRSKHRPRNDPALYTDGEYRMIQTGDVARSKGLIQTHTAKYNDVGLAQSRLWPKGTLCITIAANIADSGNLDFAACFPDSVVGFVPAPCFENARYFEYFMRTAKADLLAFAPATAQKNINLDILMQVLIPLPPLAEQQRIIAKVDELMALCDQLEATINTGEQTRSRLLEAVLHETLEPT